jgi:hypothetical protein
MNPHIKIQHELSWEDVRCSHFSENRLRSAESVAGMMIAIAIGSTRLQLTPFQVREKQWRPPIRGKGDHGAGKQGTIMILTIKSMAMLNSPY